MDSNDLEREKGITILAKNTAVQYRGHQINIIDTPATPTSAARSSAGCGWWTGAPPGRRRRGPLPQTRSCSPRRWHGAPDGAGDQQDRPAGRPPREVLDQVYSLYIDLGADESQIDFPVLYAVARQGQASTSLATARDGPAAAVRVDPLPHPASAGARRGEDRLKLLVANLDYDDYVGRLAIGRVHSGRITSGSTLAVLREGNKIEPARC
jgi:GTP-binding protein